MKTPVINVTYNLQHQFVLSSKAKSVNCREIGKRIFGRMAVGNEDVAHTKYTWREDDLDTVLARLVDMGFEPRFSRDGFIKETDVQATVEEVKEAEPAADVIEPVEEPEAEPVEEPEEGA